MINEFRQWSNILEHTYEDFSSFNLPFKKTELSSIMSKQTIDLHYDILTQNYFRKSKETGDYFQTAGAILHKLFWENIRAPVKNNRPDGRSTSFLLNEYGGFTNFVNKFEETASSVQGSGWCALLKSGNCIAISNHEKRNDIILLCDLWEHAYMFDYPGDREEYLKNWWDIVNWDMVNNRLDMYWITRI